MQVRKSWLKKNGFQPFWLVWPLSCWAFACCLEYLQKKKKITVRYQKHTIRKVKFLSKNSILTKLYNFLGKLKLSTTKKCKSPTFSRVFHPNFFLTIFLVKSKLSTAKKSKTTTFSRVFHPPKNRQFSREIKVEFLDKKMKISNTVEIRLANVKKCRE